MKPQIEILNIMPEWHEPCHEYLACEECDSRDKMGLEADHEHREKIYHLYVKNLDTNDTTDIYLTPVDSMAEANKRYSSIYKFKCEGEHYVPNKIVLEIDGQLWYGAIGFPVTDRT